MLNIVAFLFVLAVAGLFPLSRAEAADALPPKPAEEYVVLLHGLGRSSLSMKRIEFFLTEKGYHVINRTYPSTQRSVEDLSEGYLADLMRSAVPTSATRVHFVTHSLGGIVLREYLSTHHPGNLGRVVMLAPPNHGSVLADHYKTLAFARKLLGPSLLELGTASADLPNRLGPADFDCGIITGDRSANPYLGRLLTGPNDGKVSVESARLEGMKDFLVVHSTHTWIMRRDRTLRETLAFLQSGRFDHELVEK